MESIIVSIFVAVVSTGVLYYVYNKSGNISWKEYSTFFLVVLTSTALGNYLFKLDFVQAIVATTIIQEAVKKTKKGGKLPVKNIQDNLTHQTMKTHASEFTAQAPDW